MQRKWRPWTEHFKRAVSSPGNLVAAAVAVALSAATWNPLPLILYGLGEPVWLYHGTTSGRYGRRILDERKMAELAGLRRRMGWLQEQLQRLIGNTPVSVWAERGLIDEYFSGFMSLLEVRNQAAELVDSRQDVATSLEEDLITKMDEMLVAYLKLAKERYLFHLALVRVFPQMPDDPPEERVPTFGDKLKSVFVERRDAGPAPEQTFDYRRFQSVDDAIKEIRGKIEEINRAIEQDPEHDEVYRPNIEMLEKRIADLERRGANDRTMKAQLTTFPVQFDYILSQLASSNSDVSEVVGQMKLLIDQTDDTVNFARDMRDTERFVASAA